MAIHGCYHSVRSDINTIKNTLNLTGEEQQERGLMFVLKEIVQNADDCGADRLGFGVSQGLPQANHSLLQGPAIIAVNNGPFHLTDVEGIGAIGLSTKENDSSAVGKFGQGLKTVFLICEAFFYLPGPPGPKVDPGVEPRYMYNPWYVKRNDSPVVSWDSEEFSETDEQYIIAERQKLGLADGFTLWIPLRQRELCRRRNNGRPRAIVPKFLEDDPEWLDREFQGNLANELADLMPLLKCIRRIDLHDGKRLGSIQFRQGSQQCIKSFSQQEEVLPKIKGHIEFSNANLSTNYYGYQKLLNNANLLALKERDDWPTITAIDDWDEEISDKQKAEPHCAVVLQTRASAHKKSQLIIRWAVFLPTEKAPSGDLVEAIPFTSVDGSSQHIVLTLHGFFFLQSDRRQIYSWSRDDNGITQEWNKILAEQGTLRLLLPTLENFAHERSPQSVKVLTQALATSKLYETYQQHICAEGVWLCILNFHEQPSQLQWHFERTKTAQNLLTIPESTFERLPEIFPTLAEICRDRIITFHEWPSLAGSDYRPQSWSPDDIGSLLRGAQRKAVEICVDSDNVEVLCTFLTHALPSQKISIPDVSQPLTELLRNAFVGESFQPADNLRKLVAKLPSQQILGLPNDLPETLYTRLLQLATECLLVPGNLAPSNDLPQLSEQDACELLKTLVSEVSNSEAVEQFVIKIFNQVQSPATESWQQIRQLDLFRVSEIGTDENSPEFRPFDWITLMQRKNRIFSDREGTVLAKSLAAALQQPIFFVHTRIEKHHLQVSNCTISSILGSWLNQTQPPELTQAAENRVPLLQEILKLDLINPQVKQVARYLLHGDSAQLKNVNDNLYPDDHHSDQSLWSRILRHLLGDSHSWKFIGKAFLEILTPLAHGALHIKSADSEGVTGRLQEIINSGIDTGFINWTSFNKEDREGIIHQLPVDLLRRLCIHEPLNWKPGQPLAAINSDSYLEPTSNDFKISPELAEALKITLIRRCDRSYDIAQKQRKVSPPISAREVVERILMRSDRAEHWETIIDALKHSSTECRQILNLKSTRWLPLAVTAKVCAPNEVIYLPKIQNEVKQLCEEFNWLYIPAQCLPQKIQREAEVLFPKRKQAISMLGEMLSLSSASIYHVGEIPLDEFKNSNQWSEAFQALPGIVDVMPAFIVLEKLKDIDLDSASELFSTLAKPIDCERLITIQSALSEAHVTCQKNTLKESILRTYVQYLKISVQHSEWLTIFQQIRLMNKVGEWKSASQLCSKETDFDPRDIVDPELADILPKEQINIVLNSTASEAYSEVKYENAEVSTLEVLKTYFKRWPRQTNNSVGILLKFLGGKNPSEISQMANHYLPEINSILEDLNLQNKNIKDLKNSIESHLFLVNENHENTKEIPSLLGTPFLARLLDETEAESLIVDFQKIVIEGRPQVKLVLRQIIDTHDAISLNRWAKSSLKLIIEKIYKYSVKNFDDFWDKLQESSPPEIEKTQSMLIRYALVSLSNQLGSREGSKIKKVISESFRLDEQIEELKVLWSKYPERKEQYGRQMGKIHESLSSNNRKIQKLIELDQSTQDCFLKGVKERIARATYNTLSIPFEIFQNADDACLELYEMSQHDVSKSFQISLNNSTLRFLHWGRAINQYQYKGNSFREKGYDRDLLKMLLLNFSDKAENVTGKFGLGFKSIFLLTSKPRVISDRLGFDVIGGIYPKQLSEEEFRKTSEHLGDEKSGTLIEGKVSEEEAQPVVEEFMKCAPLLGAFSRWIKDINIRLKQNKWTWSWSEEPVIRASDVFVGKSRNPKAGKSLSALLLGDSTRRCLIELGSSGCVQLSKDYPTFWVTVPTRKKLDLGFVINAPFHLDVGRLRLDLSGSGKSHNEKLAKELGQQFSQALVSLLSLNDEELRTSLDLSREATRLTFWDSIWEILAKSLSNQSSVSDEINLIKDIFWPNNCWSVGLGLARLYTETEYAALPTGLTKPDAFNCLTKITDISWTLDIYLSQNLNVLTKILEWPIFRKGECLIHPGQIISYENLEILKRLGYSNSEKTRKIKELSLSKALSLQFSDAKVSVEASHQVEQLFSKEVIKEFINDSLKEPERMTVEKLLKSLLFMAQDKSWHLSQDLLAVESSDEGSEEYMLSQFLPDSYHLQEDYELGSLAFFYACRGDRGISTEAIGKWILTILANANRSDKHRHCIQYLVSSKNRDDVINHLKTKVSKNTLAHIIQNQSQSEEKYGVSIYSLQDLLSRLSVLDTPSSKSDEEVTHVEIKPTSLPLSPQKSTKILESIFEWWQSRNNTSNSLIKRYESNIYPSRTLGLNTQNCRENDKVTTRRWIELFMISAFHTIGWSKQEDRNSYRRFLELCEQWNWMEVMVDEDSIQVEWIKLLDQYFAVPRIGDRLEYYQYIRYYPAFYAFSKWHKAYRTSLLSVEDDNRYKDRVPNTRRREITLPIEIILNPQVNPMLQGSAIGIDAPPIGSILGIGSTFLIRELVRAEILTNSKMYPYSYVPLKRVRDLLVKIGCDSLKETNNDKAVDRSVQIHRFLVKHLGEERATFNKAFDLPFLMLLAEDAPIQERVLGFRI
ncbi:sacsin N-terminal ATP-binding-like domain-containing protein [Nodosilinea sp. E11]|uniref:sacsin N-terminal ATP-binding-like domain-containing protein n=1 Tax=Nodosilinea sp. E11 TaxID=3037479 RepID=UPI0029349F93|nr:hypothetical protein [Nodosilinea sp. E11]WOD39896.1 hypothetical protein RRF56_03720 [Nodosilinea sp. E11]